MNIPPAPCSNLLNRARTSYPIFPCSHLLPPAPARLLQPPARQCPEDVVFRGVPDNEGPGVGELGEELGLGERGVSDGDVTGALDVTVLQPWI